MYTEKAITKLMAKIAMSLTEYFCASKPEVPSIFSNPLAKEDTCIELPFMVSVSVNATSGTNVKISPTTTAVAEYIKSFFNAFASVNSMRIRFY